MFIRDDFMQKKIRADASITPFPLRDPTGVRNASINAVDHYPLCHSLMVENSDDSTGKICPI